MKWNHALVFGGETVYTVRPRLVRARLLGTVHMYGWLTYKNAVYILMRKVVLVKEQENMNSSGKIILQWTSREKYETYAYCVSTGEIFRVNGERDLVEFSPMQDCATADFYELLVSEGIKPSMVLARLNDIFPKAKGLEVKRSFCGGWTISQSGKVLDQVALFTNLK